MMPLVPAPGAKKRPKRFGRGLGSGHGKTSGRGQKGQKARGYVARGFEGGQTALHHRLPQLRGRSKKAMNVGMFRKEFATVSVSRLNSLPGDTVVTPELLLSKGVIKKLKDGLKVLGDGQLEKPFTVRAHAFSATASDKILQAGGKVEVI
jgi:large subunit ribosomal protein L15